MTSASLFCGPEILLGSIPWTTALLFCPDIGGVGVASLLVVNNKASLRGSLLSGNLSAPCPWDALPSFIIVSTKGCVAGLLMSRDQSMEGEELSTSKMGSIWPGTVCSESHSFSFLEIT